MTFSAVLYIVMQKVSWHISKEDRRPPWVIIVFLSAISLGVAIYFWTVQNNFATVFFGISPLVFWVLATQGPKDVKYELDDKHVKVNNTEYGYKKFTYYSFVDDFLVLKLKKEEHALYIPLPEDKAKKAENLVSQHLKEGEHEETMGEIVNRIFNIY